MVPCLVAYSAFYKAVKMVVLKGLSMAAKTVPMMVPSQDLLMAVKMEPWMVD